MPDMAEKKKTSRSFVGDEPGTSPIMAVFKKAAKELLDRHDRHERISRLCRDVNIESKRIISLLHTIVTDEMKQIVIDEAKHRIQTLISGLIKDIALEMQNVSAYLHHKALTGLQEYVEARIFLSFIEQGQLVSLTDMRNEMTYTIISGDGNTRVISTLLTPQDYILGLADVSGEVMKKAISGLSTGSVDQCFNDREMLRELYTGFLGLYGNTAIINNKLTMTTANVCKVERALCDYIVRGSEVIPELNDKQTPDNLDAMADQSIED